MESAARRVRGNTRARRQDRGAGRIDPRAEARLQELLSAPDKPNLSAVTRTLVGFCGELGIPPPSRSSVYNAVERAKMPSYRIASLPRELRDTLHNLDREPNRRLSGDLLVFHAFNYGTPRAISFAAGLPWLCLCRALCRVGWRPKSRALLEAVAAYRGI